MRRMWKIPVFAVLALPLAFKRYGLAACCIVSPFVFFIGVDNMTTKILISCDTKCLAVSYEPVTAESTNTSTYQDKELYLQSQYIAG